MTTANSRVLVLVADDNDGLRETTAMILRQSGYTVVEAKDGEEALEKLTADRFDVAILDVRMPKKDGIWVVENIAPEPPPPGIVLASAYAFDQEMRDRLGTKVFRYLRKPVPPTELIETVDQAAELAPKSRI
jgi:two-component system, NtrC family, nitrogen regulation response regulator NtrX